MSYRVNHSELKIKKRSFFMLLIAGGCASAFAQQLPALPLPTLPSLPPVKYEKPTEIPTTSSKDQSPASKGSPSATTSATIPTLPKIESPSLQSAAIRSTGSKTPIAVPNQIGNAVIDNTPTLPDIQVNTNAAPALPGMPALPLPGGASPAVVPLPQDPLAEGTVPTLTYSLGDISDEPPAITWRTKLAPSIIPKETNFKYKRNLLPETVYRTEYDKNNRHLPLRITRDDYTNLLFNSVANNDINGTRALLNAGVSLNATNPYGETPLMLAQRMGATQVAALLVARGAIN
jgi:hypothetical protein